MNGAFGNLARGTIVDVALGRFYGAAYKLPVDLEKGKAAIKAKFSVPAGQRGGRVAGCRLMQQER
jgi:hypothetical protein